MLTDYPVQPRAEQLNRAVDTLTSAFQDDIIKLTLAPNVRNREKLTQWVFQGTVRYCLRYGEVHITDNADGVACWLRPGQTTNNFWGSMRSWNMFPGPFLLAGFRTMQNFFALLDFTEKQHKRLMQRPHWYLWALAVRPECQGQGLGGKLLAPVMERMDREGVASYLETQTEQNVAFYQRRGFEVIDSAEILGINLWFMMREPKR